MIANYWLDLLLHWTVAAIFACGFWYLIYIGRGGK